MSRVFGGFGGLGSRLLPRFLAVSVVVFTLGSASSCAQVLGIDKEYKKGKQVPDKWNCFGSFYDEIGSGAKDPICDCECGVFDPDCDETDSPVTNHVDDEDTTIDDTGKPDDPGCRSCDEDGACSSASP